MRNFYCDKTNSSLVIFAIFLLIFTSVPRIVFSLPGDPPFQLPAREQLAKLRTAVIYTELGEIHFELFPEVAPWHVANFKYRADKGLYKNSKFHIFEPNYLVQGGAENGDEKHQPVYWLPPEFSEMKHEPGILGMARQPDSINPQRRSHGSQFHLILGYPAHMDSHYTIFGKLTKGMDVLQRLRRNDIIYDIKVFVRPLKKSPAKGLPRRDNPQ